MIYVEGSFFYVHFLNIFSRILSKDERQARKSSVSYLRWPGVLTDVLNWEKSPTFGPRERTRRITDFRFQKTVTRNLMQKPCITCTITWLWRQLYPESAKNIICGFFSRIATKKKAKPSFWRYKETRRQLISFVTQGVVVRRKTRPILWK